jgi:hypothetical protein
MNMVPMKTNMLPSPSRAVNRNAFLIIRLKESLQAIQKLVPCKAIYLK